MEKFSSCFLLLSSVLCFPFSFLMSARTKKRNPWIIGVFGMVILFALWCSRVLFFYPKSPTRIGVALIGTPTIVLSYDPTRQSMTALRIPSDVTVDVVRGYGAYPLSSLWKLDAIDKRKGKVYTETLEEATGIALQYYLEGSAPSKDADTITGQIQQSLTLGSCVQALMSPGKTNMPAGLLFALSRAFSGMNPTDMAVFDVTDAILVNSSLADGTTIKKIDREKLTLLLGTRAEDPQIRKENYRIALFNTTDMPGLGQKVTRVIETLGFHVSAISNDDTFQKATCDVRASKDVLESHTAQTLVWLYGCSTSVEEQSAQADISLRIGSDFAKRFVSF